MVKQEKAADCTLVIIHAYLPNCLISLFIFVLYYKKNAAAPDARPPTKKRRGSAAQNGVASDAASVTSVTSADTPGTPSAIASPIVKSNVSTASTPVLPQA
jgi:hypothetical protein